MCEIIITNKEVSLRGTGGNDINIVLTYENVKKTFQLRVIFVSIESYDRESITPPI